MAAGQAIRAGAAYIELFTKDSRMVKGLRSASQKLEAFGASVQGMGLHLVAAGGAVIAPLLAAVQHFATAGDQVNKASDRTGVAVEALSELAYAADQSGAKPVQETYRETRPDDRGEDQIEVQEVVGTVQRRRWCGTSRAARH